MRLKSASIRGIRVKEFLFLSAGKAALFDKGSYAGPTTGRHPENFRTRSHTRQRRRKLFFTVIRIYVAAVAVIREALGVYATAGVFHRILLFLGERCDRLGWLERVLDKGRLSGKR